jgi:hypothetical protein
VFRALVGDRKGWRALLAGGAVSGLILQATPQLPLGAGVAARLQAGEPARPAA